MWELHYSQSISSNEKTKMFASEDVDRSYSSTLLPSGEPGEQKSSPTPPYFGPQKRLPISSSHFDPLSAHGNEGKLAETSAQASLQGANELQKTLKMPMNNAVVSQPPPSASSSAPKEDHLFLEKTTSQEGENRLRTSLTISSKADSERDETNGDCEMKSGSGPNTRIGNYRKSDISSANARRSNASLSSPFYSLSSPRGSNKSEKGRTNRGKGIQVHPPMLRTREESGSPHSASFPPSPLLSPFCGLTSTSRGCATGSISGGGFSMGFNHLGFTRAQNVTPIVHMRLRPLLPRFGEKTNQRKVWVLNHENVVVRDDSKIDRPKLTLPAGPSSVPTKAKSKTNKLSTTSFPMKKKGALVSATSPGASHRLPALLSLASFRTPSAFASSSGKENPFVREESFTGTPSISGRTKTDPIQGINDALGACHRGSTCTEGSLDEMNNPSAPFQSDSRSVLSRAPSDSSQHTAANSFEPLDDVKNNVASSATANLSKGSSSTGIYARDPLRPNSKVFTPGGVWNDEQHFSFDVVHDENATQEEVFDDSVLGIVDEALQATNVAILCYGATGSGKTYSMMGNMLSEDDKGVKNKAVNSPKDAKIGKMFLSNVGTRVNAASGGLGKRKGLNKKEAANSLSEKIDSVHKGPLFMHQQLKPKKKNEKTSLSPSPSPKKMQESVAHILKEGDEVRDGFQTLTELSDKSASLHHMRTMKVAEKDAVSINFSEMGILPRLIQLLLDRVSEGPVMSIPVGDATLFPLNVASISERAGGVPVHAASTLPTTDPEEDLGILTNGNTSLSNPPSNLRQSKVYSSSQISLDKDRVEIVEDAVRDSRKKVLSNQSPIHFTQLSMDLRELVFYGVEIYNDEFSDLLDPQKRKLSNINDTAGLEGLCEKLNQKESSGGGMKISNMDDLLRAYRMALKNRTTSSHSLNDTSSRSHAIFIVELQFDVERRVEQNINLDHKKEVAVEPREGTLEGGSSESAVVSSGGRNDSLIIVDRIRSYVALVDLAGSERVKETMVQGIAFKEAQFINKSLSALSSVMLALFHDSSHIPYRDSKLTRVLRPCLQTGHVLLLVHVSPCSGRDAVNTLKFADQIRHTRVRVHGLSSAKRELQEIFEDLVGATYSSLKNSVLLVEAELRLVIAEVRLAELSRSTVAHAAVGTSHLGESVSGLSRSNISKASHPGPGGDASYSSRIRIAIAPFVNKFNEYNQKLLDESIASINKQREAKLESYSHWLQHQRTHLKAAIEEIDRYNRELAAANELSVPQDSYLLEITRLIAESRDNLNQITQEKVQVQALVSTLKQRIHGMKELEDAVDAELAAVHTAPQYNYLPPDDLPWNTNPDSSPLQPSHDVRGFQTDTDAVANENSGHDGDSLLALHDEVRMKIEESSSHSSFTEIGGGGASIPTASVSAGSEAPPPTSSFFGLPIFSRSRSFQGPSTAISVVGRESRCQQRRCSASSPPVDAELRELSYNQILLSREMSALRMEMQCFSIGESIWEGVWAQSMRKELLVAMWVESLLMEFILLDEGAMEMEVGEGADQAFLKKDENEDLDDDEVVLKCRRHIFRYLQQQRSHPGGALSSTRCSFSLRGNEGNSSFSSVNEINRLNGRASSTLEKVENGEGNNVFEYKSLFFSSSSSDSDTLPAERDKPIATGSSRASSVHDHTPVQMEQPSDAENRETVCPPVLSIRFASVPPSHCSVSSGEISATAGEGYFDSPLFGRRKRKKSIVLPSLGSSGNIPNPLDDLQWLYIYQQERKRREMKDALNEIGRQVVDCRVPGGGIRLSDQCASRSTVVPSFDPLGVDALSSRSFHSTTTQPNEGRIDDSLARKPEEEELIRKGLRNQCEGNHKCSPSSRFCNRGSHYRKLLASPRRLSSQENSPPPGSKASLARGALQGESHSLDVTADYFNSANSKRSTDRPPHSTYPSASLEDRESSEPNRSHFHWRVPSSVVVSSLSDSARSSFISPSPEDPECGLQAPQRYLSTEGRLGVRRTKKKRSKDRMEEILNYPEAAALAVVHPLYPYVSLFGSYEREEALQLKSLLHLRYTGIVCKVYCINESFDFVSENFLSGVHSGKEKVNGFMHETSKLAKDSSGKTHYKKFTQCTGRLCLTYHPPSSHARVIQTNSVHTRSSEPLDGSQLLHERIGRYTLDFYCSSYGIPPPPSLFLPPFCGGGQRVEKGDRFSRKVYYEEELMYKKASEDRASPERDNDPQLPSAELGKPTVSNPLSLQTMLVNEGSPMLQTQSSEGGRTAQAYCRSFSSRRTSKTFGLAPSMKIEADGIRDELCLSPINSIDCSSDGSLAGTEGESCVDDESAVYEETPLIELVSCGQGREKPSCRGAAPPSRFRRYWREGVSMRRHVHRGWKLFSIPLMEPSLALTLHVMERGTASSIPLGDLEKEVTMKELEKDITEKLSNLSCEASVMDNIFPLRVNQSSAKRIQVADFTEQPVVDDKTRRKTGSTAGSPLTFTSPLPRSPARARKDKANRKSALTEVPENPAMEEARKQREEILEEFERKKLSVSLQASQPFDGPAVALCLNGIPEDFNRFERSQALLRQKEFSSETRSRVPCGCTSTGGPTPWEPSSEFDSAFLRGSVGSSRLTHGGVLALPTTRVVVNPDVENTNGRHDANTSQMAPVSEDSAADAANQYTILLTFPPPLVEASTQMQNMESLVAALSGLMVPKSTAVQAALGSSVQSRSGMQKSGVYEKENAGASLHRSVNASTVPYSHLPYLLLMMLSADQEEREREAIGSTPSPAPSAAPYEALDSASQRRSKFLTAGPLVPPSRSQGSPVPQMSTAKGRKVRGEAPLTMSLASADWSFASSALELGDDGGERLFRSLLGSNVSPSGTPSRGKISPSCYPPDGAGFASPPLSLGSPQSAHPVTLADRKHQNKRNPCISVDDTSSREKAALNSGMDRLSPQRVAIGRRAVGEDRFPLWNGVRLPSLWGATLSVVFHFPRDDLESSSGTAGSLKSATPFRASVRASASNSSASAYLSSDHLAHESPALKSQVLDAAAALSRLRSVQIVAPERPAEEPQADKLSLSGPSSTSKPSPKSASQPNSNVSPMTLKMVMHTIKGNSISLKKTFQSSTASLESSRGLIHVASASQCLTDGTPKSSRTLRGASSVARGDDTLSALSKNRSSHASAALTGVRTQMQWLQMFRRNVQQLIKQQLYDAEDIRSELPQAVLLNQEQLQRQCTAEYKRAKSDIVPAKAELNVHSYSLPSEAMLEEGEHLHPRTPSFQGRVAERLANLSSMKSLHHRRCSQLGSSLSLSFGNSGSCLPEELKNAFSTAAEAGSNEQLPNVILTYHEEIIKEAQHSLGLTLPPSMNRFILPNGMDAEHDAAGQPLGPSKSLFSTQAVEKAPPSCEVQVFDGREIFGNAAPWSVWQWSYRWKNVGEYEARLHENASVFAAGRKENTSFNHSTARVSHNKGLPSSHDEFSETVKPNVGSENCASQRMLASSNSSSSSDSDGDDDDAFGSAVSWIDEAIMRASTTLVRRQAKTVQLPKLRCAEPPIYLEGIQSKAR